jgi:hypothetical protein
VSPKQRDTEPNRIDHIRGDDNGRQRLHADERKNVFGFHIGIDNG